jgi:multiple sugar transport system ATP-binding protein
VYEQPANVFVAGFLGAPGMNLIPGRVRRGPQAQWFVGRGLAVSVPETMAELLGAGADADIVLGIRPEHLRLRRTTAEVVGTERSARAPTVVGSGRVVMTEPLGPSNLTTVMLDNRPLAGEPVLAVEAGVGKTEIAVALPPGEMVEIGQDVTIGLDPARIQWFDTRTGENLSVTRPRSRHRY